MESNHKHKFDPEFLKNGGYVLFLDILGFANLVEKSHPEDIYSIIDSSLKAFQRWEELNRLFKTIYFSDTFIFYQSVEGYGDWAFLDVYAISGMILTTLLAREIPARGAISFGELVVRNDAQDKHQVFYGKALVEAYKAEQRDQWIGITIQPSERISLFRVRLAILLFFR